MLSLQTALANISGVGPRFAQRLKRLKLVTVGDLLRHFPSRYEDFSHIYKIAELEAGQQATIQGTIENITSHYTFRRRMTIVEAKVRDDSGAIRAVWFNQPYLKNILRPGIKLNLAGKVTAGEEGLYLSHPIYELAPRSKSQNTAHTARLVPIYPETQGLTSKGLRFLIQPLLERLPPLTEWLPPEVRLAHKLPEINTAFRNIHFPRRLEDAVQAKRRFALENIFLLQLANLQQKLKLAHHRAPPIAVDLNWLKQILARLPFELTLSQKRSLWEILQDMAKPRPMNRLLQGDVGSGKTVVAALAALTAAQSGYQTAIMAPTEVLARQHFETFRKLFANLDPPNQPTLGLLTANAARILYGNDLETETKKDKLRQLVSDGEIKIIIGTHALITASQSKSSNEKKQKTAGAGLQFQRLGVVIIDEQHRFGVEQRARLASYQSLTPNRNQPQATPLLTKELPHFLSMSATPIPRTLMLTVFGDLDISILNELPSGRKKVITKVVSPQHRDRAYEFIRAQIQKGRQAFVICPRIEPQATEENQISPSTPHGRRLLTALETKSVKEEYEKLSQKIFPDLRVAMLHGQLKAKTKEEIMRKFRNREVDILVSTSVIEVGVDVPNATIMMIEGAERFGLAQLYQFRGRVGRGEHQSFCFLFTESFSTTVINRLQAVARAKSGFELAEIDLKLRGPGELLGQRQTGLPDTAMRALQDVELVKTARAAALKILETDPRLKRYPELLKKVSEFEKEIHPE